MAKYIHFLREWISFLPVVFASAVVPLIVAQKFVPLHGSALKYWNGEIVNVDFFSYYKMLLLIGCGALCLLILVTKRFFLSVPKSFSFLVALYAVCIIVSTLISGEKDIAFIGYPDRYEGCFVILSYLAVLSVTMLCVTRASHIALILGPICLSGLLIGLIGLLEFWGNNPLASDLLKGIILSNEEYATHGSLLIDTYKHSISSTLYNSNYVGSYTAMLFPLTFGLGNVFKHKGIKITALCLSVLFLVNLLGCRSRGGILGGMIAIIILIYMLRKQIRSHIGRWFVLFATVCTLGLLGVNHISGGTVLNSTKSLFTEGITISEKGLNDLQIKNLSVAGNKIELVTTEDQISIIHEKGQLIVRSPEGNPLLLDADDGLLTIREPGYENYRFQIHTDNQLDINRVGLPSLRFWWTDGEFRLLNDKNEVFQARVFQKSGWHGKERIGSGRLYIWAKSMPLLFDTFIWGFGPDTFAAHFPQDAPVLKANIYGRTTVLIDKPHNMYLQIAINTGVVSLIAVIVLLSMYAVTSWHLYGAGDIDSVYAKAGVCVFAGVCGYAITGFFNDSVVSVAPVFWTLLGLGLAINHLTKEEKISH